MAQCRGSELGGREVNISEALLEKMDLGRSCRMSVVRQTYG